MTVFGDGTQTRAFSYIGDVAPLMARSVENPEAMGETFNIGADEVISLNELTAVVAEAMGVTPAVKYLPARQEVRHAAADHAKVRRVFRYEPRWKIRDGIARMAEWAKRFGARKPGVFEEIEIREKLPEGWL
jgi:UDP-glucose 4-epimerase